MTYTEILAISYLLLYFYIWLCLRPIGISEWRLSIYTCLVSFWTKRVHSHKQWLYDFLYRAFFRLQLRLIQSKRVYHIYKTQYFWTVYESQIYRFDQGFHLIFHHFHQHANKISIEFTQQYKSIFQSRWQITMETMESITGMADLPTLLLLCFRGMNGDVYTEI